MKTEIDAIGVPLCDWYYLPHLWKLLLRISMVQQEQGGAEDAKMLIYVRTHIRDMKLQWQIASKQNVTRKRAHAKSTRSTRMLYCTCAVSALDLRGGLRLRAKQCSTLVFSLRPYTLCSTVLDCRYVEQLDRHIRFTHTYGRICSVD